jgi:hypothetical protein
MSNPNPNHISNSQNSFRNILICVGVAAILLAVIGVSLYSYSNKPKEVAIATENPNDVEEARQQKYEQEQNVQQAQQAQQTTQVASQVDINSGYNVNPNNMSSASGVDLNSKEQVVASYTPPVASSTNSNIIASQPNVNTNVANTNVHIASYPDNASSTSQNVNTEVFALNKKMLDMENIIALQQQQITALAQQKPVTKVVYNNHVAKKDIKSSKINKENTSQELYIEDKDKSKSSINVSAKVGNMVWLADEAKDKQNGKIITNEKDVLIRSSSDR